MAGNRGRALGPVLFLCAGMHAPAGREIQNRHSNGDAVFDLVEDERAGAVGDVGRDLDAAVHGAGVEDDGVLFGQVEAVVRETIVDRIFAKRREVGRILPLALYSEDHDDVRPADGVLYVGANR